MSAPPSPPFPGPRLAPSPASPEAAVAPRPPTLVFIEDNDSCRRALSLLLAARGYHVLPARTGALALEESERHAGPVDLVISDLGLEDGPGDATVRRLRAARPGLPALYVSGRDATDPSVRRALRTGNALFLRKPFTLEALVHHIEQLLAEAASPPAD